MTSVSEDTTHHGGGQTPEHRHDRLRLHGPDALQRLPQGQQLLRPRSTARCSRRSAAATRRRPRRSPTSGATSRSRPTGGSCIERKDIDAVDICTPNNTHKEIAIAAAKAGKMILCEKPLAMNAAEGRGDGRGGREGRRCRTPSGTTTAACPPSRWPSSSSTRASSAGSSTTAPTSSRTGRSPPTCRRAARASGGSTSAAAGCGVTGDLLAHCIDTALWLNGDDHAASAR